MEKKIKIFKTVAILFIIFTISLISFVGVFRDSLNKMVNIIPSFVYGMELGGTREFKLTLDTSSEEKNIYVDDNGNYKGTVATDEGASTGEISLETKTDEAGDTVAKEAADEVKYKTEKRTIKANEDSVLNKESYEKTKKIIQTRLENAHIPEYNIRLDNISGNLIIEVPENDHTAMVHDLAIHQGKFELLDGQTGELLMDNDDIKKAVAVYNSQEGYQAYLQIEFNKDKVETLKEISKTYVKITNDADEEETKTVKFTIDGQVLLETYFGDEIPDGRLVVSMGETTTDYATFTNNYENASYFANLLNNGKTPNAYALASDNFVKSQITTEILDLAKLIFAGAIAIASIVLICKYKYDGVLASIASIGYIAVTLLAIRYTSVTITLNSTIALVGIVIVNYVFMINFLNRFKTDSKKHAFMESVKEINITIIPLWVVAVIFTFMTNVAISSVGMILFWGLFVHLIYNFAITRTLYVD